MSRRRAAWFAIFLSAAISVHSLAATTQERTFPADAVINVTLPPYNAVPRDGADVTGAIQRAITENVGTGRVLYFPAGIYELSDTLMAKDAAGLWKPRLTIQGAGRDRTIFKLKNSVAGFGDPVHPKAILMTGSLQEKGDSTDGGGNKAFFNNIRDLSIDTGSGNAGAIGVEYAVSNQGAIDNVSIHSGDGHGAAGIAMRRRIPGPGLLKNVSITGFDVGIDVGDMQYGITMEDITLRNQRIAGIRDSQNVLHIRHLNSVNRVPGILTTDPHAVVTLLDSQFTGGAPDQAAVDCAGSLLIHNVTTDGYRPAAVRAYGHEVNGPTYADWTWPAAVGAGAGAELPVEETPEYWNPNLPDWIAVGPRAAGESDDTNAMQRAIDSGKSTVYFQNNRSYFLSDTVIVRGAVRQILGMGSEISLGAAREPFSDIAHPRPLLRIDSTTGPVFLDGLFFNAQYPGEVIFENNAPADLVMKHCAGWVGTGGHRHAYRNTAKATGKLFLEDVYLPGWEFTKQRVWARQLNPENNDGDGTEPLVKNMGGKLWILGFKTEGPAPFIETVDGAATELLGAYNYISATDAAKVPATSVPYLVKDSTAALSFTTDNFRDNDYDVYIRTITGNRTTDLRGADLWPRNGNRGDRSFVVTQYRSK